MFFISLYKIVPVKRKFSWVFRKSHLNILKKIFHFLNADNSYFFCGLPGGKNLIIKTNKTKTINNTTLTIALSFMLL